MIRAVVAYFAALLRRRQARRRLQRIVEATATSHATTDYRIRRAAAKAGWARRKGGLA